MAFKRPDGTWLVTRTSSGDWHPEEVKSAVRMIRDADGQAWSLGRLGSENGLPEHACRTAIRQSDADGEAVIAKLLGVKPSAIWPSRYRKDGTRIHAGRRHESISTSHRDGRHCEFESAA